MPQKTTCSPLPARARADVPHHRLWPRALLSNPLAPHIVYTGMAPGMDETSSR